MKNLATKIGMYLLAAGIINISSQLQAQNVGINSTGSAPNNSAGLDVDFTNKGLLIPRVSLTGPTDNTTISNPATSLLVYNTASAGGLTPGYYYNAGTPASPNWVRLLNGGTPGTAWLLNGNAGTTAGTHFLGTTDNVDLVFKTNNTERMRITNTGNVGIGTTSPSYKLHIRNGVVVIDQPGFTAPNGILGFGLKTDNSWGSWDRSISIANGSDVSLVALGAWGPNGTTADLAYIGANRSNQWITILTANGNVGIGTTTPVNKLQVANGDVRVGEINPSGTGTFPAYGRKLYFSGGPAAGGADSDNSDPLWIARYNVNPFGMGPSDMSNLRINIGDNCGGTDDALEIVIDPCAGGGSQILHRFRNDGYAENVLGWGTISDMKLKKNILPLPVGLNEILKLQTISYSYNGKGGTPNDDIPRYGFLAQDVEKVLPVLVFESINNANQGLEINKQ